MTKRLSVVQLAVLLSLGLHGVAGWWLLHADPPVQRITVQPVAEERRLQVTLLPVAKPADVPVALAKAPVIPASPLSKRAGRAESSTARSTVTAGKTAERESAAVSIVAPGPAAPAAGGNQALQPQLDLNLGAAAKAAERQRSQSPLAGAIDAQQMQTGAAKTARALSKLEAIRSSIVEETITADGGRVIRFSGGGCMRMPNPSARSHDDVRKPAVETC